MKNTLKRIMALMLSLVMMLGCVPSFINEASADGTYYLKMIINDNNMNQIPYGTKSSDIKFYLSTTQDKPYKTDDKTDYIEATSITGFTLDADDVVKKEEQNIQIRFPKTGCSNLWTGLYSPSDVYRDAIEKSDSSTSDDKKYYESGEETIINVKVNVIPCSMTSLTIEMPELVLGDQTIKYEDITSTDFDIHWRGLDEEDIGDYIYLFEDSAYIGQLDGDDYTEIPLTVQNGKIYKVIFVVQSLDKKEISFSNLNKITFNGNELELKDNIKEQGFLKAYSAAGSQVINAVLLFDFTGPKTPITSLSLGGTGSLEGGKASSDQTLKWTEPDGAHFTSDDAEGSTWYKNNTCSSGDEVTTFRASETYYKKVTLTPASGYEFDTDKIKTISVTNGTFDSFISKSKSKIEAVISAKATGITVTLNYTKPNSYKSFKDITIPDYTVTGATSAGIVGKGQISDITEDNTDKGTFYLFTSLNFNSDDEVNSVEKILFRGTNIYVDSNRTPSTTNLDKMSLMKTHNVVWYIGTHQIVVIEKFDYRMTENVTFTGAPGMTAADVLASITINEGTSFEGGVFPFNDSGMILPMPLAPTNKLEDGKKYRLMLIISDEGQGQLYSKVKVNNVDLTYDTELDQSKDGWKANENKLDVNYTFECKNQSSGGGHKKKKTEEPKQDEPKEDPKTLEEKMEEELKKDDVKKANSNEGEKINPSAKYINGYDDGSFKPNNKVNNIELMSMVTELFDNVDIKETKDLNQGKDYWGQEIIDKANALGLIPGNKDNKNYNLMGDVTRGDLAIVVYNLVNDYTDAPNLKDRNNCKDAIGKSYEKEAAKLLELGIFKGYDDGLFHGDYTLTRAEAVVVINRALKSLGFEIKMPNITLSFPDLSEEHWAYAEIMYAANK